MWPGHKRIECLVRKCIILSAQNVPPCSVRLPEILTLRGGCRRRGNGLPRGDQRRRGNCRRLDDRQPPGDRRRRGHGVDHRHPRTAIRVCFARGRTITYAREREDDDLFDREEEQTRRRGQPCSSARWSEPHRIARLTHSRGRRGHEGDDGGEEETT